MMGWSPRCYIPSSVEIGPPVKEKNILDRLLPYGGVAAILVMSSDFHFLVPVSFHIKVGSDLHSRFCENPVQMFVCTGPWAKVKK